MMFVSGTNHKKVNKAVSLKGEVLFGKLDFCRYWCFMIQQVNLFFPPCRSEWCKEES